MATVLIVDDEPNNRLLMQTLLAHAGYATIEAATGRNAIALAAHARPDAIIVDLSLPDMSGLDVIRAVRANSSTAHIAIALHTATTLQAALNELLALYDIATVIPKPVDPRQFLEMVTSLLSTVQ